MENIDLRSLIRIILKRWWIPAIAAVTCAVAMTFVCFFLMKPVYQSDTTLYIGKQMNEDSSLAYNDILLGNQLVKDYRELAKSRLVVSAVLKDLKLKDRTVGQLAGNISVNLKNDTRVIQITVQDLNPVTAMKITNKVAEVFKDKAVEIMRVENVSVIDTAVMPGSPVKPNKKMNIAVAFMIGLLAGVGIIFLIEYLDDTIKTPEDVKQYVDLPVIGTIPVFPE